MDYNVLHGTKQRLIELCCLVDSIRDALGSILGLDAGLHSVFRDYSFLPSTALLFNHL